jgi:hypothetical protein
MDRLSWNEIRTRAAAFAKEWADSRYEKGEAQTFWNEFFEIFGITGKRVASFEEPVKKLGDKRGFIDLIWKGLLSVEQKSAGRDLSKAKAQLFDYFPGLTEEELPRFIVACDFQNFELHALETGEQLRFKLADLHKHIHHFGFIRGLERRTFREQDPVNVKASYLMGELHDALKASGYKGHDLEVFLVRLLFCLFADDTGVFEPRGIFLEFVQTRTREDGSDMGAKLSELFQVLNEPRESRQKTLDEDLHAFDYVNGDLFRVPARTPAFDAKMRKLLLKACEFDWSAISPAIFGALFQSVMADDQRRRQGAHYTTERNILKVIEPLFLDDLRVRFAKIAAQRGHGKRRALEAFRGEIASLTFFDPACGCGNFLVIAYREIRELEMEVLKELNKEGQRVTDIDQLVLCNVHQFYGLEIDEFPVRIAEVALWMMDHIMNVKASLEFGQVFRRIPIGKSPQIVHADALETDWETVLPASECNYLFGNPPFGGSKYQSAKQRAQVRRIAELGNSGGTLDYVCPWFIKAGQCLQKGTAKVGFVATNSITQGEQVAQLWPVLFERHKLEIAFAHRTFAWGSDARGKAHVHVVILGLVRRDMEPAAKRLFSYPDIEGDPMETVHDKLSPYLIDASRLANPHLVVREAGRPINGAPQIVIGSKPIDGGHYIFGPDEARAFLAAEPGAERFMRPYIGAEELINGKLRYILALQEASPAELRAMPAVLARVDKVRQYRLKSSSVPTRELASTPTLYHVNVIPDRPFLAIPKVSSERREYAPIAMPPGLRKAHLTLDRTVDALYSSGPFRSDLDRVELLLALYENLVTPMAAAMRPGRPRRARTAEARPFAQG